MHFYPHIFIHNTKKRQTVHRLLFACSVRSDYQCFQIELAKNYGLTEWRDDIKGIMLKAGLKNKQITFLFVDTQVSNRNKIST